MTAEYLKKELTEARKVADELGISLQELLLLVTYVNVDRIERKLDDLSVTTYPAYQG